MERMEKFAKPRWSTLRRVPKAELSRIEAIRKSLQREYGSWLRIAEDSGVHYNSVHRFAAGRTKRPTEDVLDKLERSLAKRRWADQ